MSRPKIGDHLYLGPDQDGPVTVAYSNGTITAFVRGHVNMLTTHQGNLYDSDGNRPYYI